MKKVISLILTILCFVLCFSGCGKTSIYGTYAFQMGAKGAQSTMGIYLDITDKDYIGTDKMVKGKSFTLTFKIPKVSDTNDVLGLFQSAMGTDINANQNSETNEIAINGYYNIGEKTGEATRLKICLPLDDIWDTEEYGPAPVIGDEVIEKMFYVTLKEDEVDFVVPVSVKNLIYQFYWYGIDIANTVEPCKTVTEHAVGTHPTDAEVDDINNNKNYPAEHDGTLYYGFNTLTMKLARIG